VALSIGSRRPGVTWHPALWSPDFPPLGHADVVGRRLSGQLRFHYNSNAGKKYCLTARDRAKSFPTR